MPEELTNADGQLCWQASYKTWGSTVSESWEVTELAGRKVHYLDEGDKLKGESAEQNLRFQGQYLDRETGLHYNTFRFYDADIGRFISPDPIGLRGGINLGSYSPNPIGWIDPLGLNAKPETAAEFEARISKLPTSERIGAVRGKVGKVADKNGWEIDPKLSRRNDRDVYRTPDGDLRAADTQHGRIEKTDGKGNHQGEIDIDGKPTKIADKSGKHNLKC